MGKPNNRDEKDKLIKEYVISDSLDENLNMIKKIFNYEINEDFITREIYINILKTRGTLVYLKGIIDENVLQQNVIKPLMNLSVGGEDTEDDIKFLMNSIITVKNTKRVSKFMDAVNDIINGETLLILDEYKEFISIDNTSVEHRAIEKPVSESVIVGPKESFVESVEVNRALLRKQIKTEDLVTETLVIGERDINTVFIMYIKDIADPDLVQRVKDRIGKLKIDTVTQVSVLQQYIEDRPYSIIPTILLTERPDRAVSFLFTGHVAILMESSPSALVAPATFWSFFHTAEDTYQRWFPGNYIRAIRFIALIITLLIPGFYIAITNFHNEMIPTDLLLSIAATRERMPFPAVIEILAMESTFELLREAGIRIPTIIGSTIGIVGALILGQAAVEANIISPIIVIIVSITGLASFALPEMGLSYVMRSWRFIFLFSGAFVGFYGIALTLILSVAYISTIESFGVPYFSPMAPHYPSSKDMVTRSPVWKQLIRPMNIKPQDKVRRQPSRGDDANG